MFKYVRLFTLFASLVLVSIAHAYNPPIGIPAPSFGIDEQAPAWPAEWPSAQSANHYYIDNSHPQATDSNNPNGYPDKPRLTIPAANFSAGSYVEMNGGPYTNTIGPQFNCTQAAPCWLRGGSSTNKTVLNGGNLRIRDSSYLIIENFDLNGGTGGIGVSGNNTHHISIRNSSVQNKPWPGGATTAISLVPDTGGKVHDIVIYNMYFAELGDWQAQTDTDYHGVGPSLWGRDSTTEEYNIWFLDSTCYHISGNCIQVNGANWPNSYQYLHHIYIGRMTSHSNRQSGLGFKQCRDVVASENLIYDQRSFGAQPGSAVVIQYGQENLWLIHNTIHSSNFGIRQSDTPPAAANFNTYFVGNTIHNIHPQNLANYNPNDAWRPGQAISFWHGNTVRHVVDNTIYDVHGGITGIYDGGMELSGNLISEIDSQDKFLWIDHPAKNGNAKINDNLFFDSDGDFHIKWNWTDYFSLSDFQNGTGQCSNCTIADPRFIDATNQDFRLGNDSAGKSMRTNVDDVYTTFFNLYGIDIRRDPAGTARPVTGGAVGAYESIDQGGGGSTPLPSPPSPPPLPSATVTSG